MECGDTVFYLERDKCGPGLVMVQLLVAQAKVISAGPEVVYMVDEDDTQFFAKRESLFESADDARKEKEEYNKKNEEAYSGTKQIVKT